MRRRVVERPLLGPRGRLGGAPASSFQEQFQALELRAMLVETQHRVGAHEPLRPGLDVLPALLREPEQLGREAALSNLRVETRRVDLEADPELPQETFDLVIDFFYLHQPLLPLLRRAVRPGGVAVLRSFSSAGPFPGGPKNPQFVLQPGELPEIFAGWEILQHEEGVEPSAKGGSLAGIVVRRPA